MRLGINLLPYTPNKHGGAEVYIRNVINTLAKLSGDHEFILFVTQRGKGGYLPPRDNFSEVVLPSWCGINRGTRIIAEQFVLPFYVWHTGVNCLFSNYVVPLIVSVPQIVNVHDMLYKRLPNLVEPIKRFYWAIMIPLSLRRSEVVLTVSHSSAEDILTYFPNVSSKIMVTVESVDLSLAAHKDINPNLVQNELGICNPFILSSATFGPHKNIETLITAFAEVHRTWPNIRLVLTGGVNTKDAERERARLIELVNTLNIREYVTFTGYVPEPLLAALYKSAQIYVNPSIFEGFGLSVLEAQFFGTPVICSNIAALVEVAGEGALVVKATSAQAFSNAIVNLLSNPETCAALTEKGFLNLSRYEWCQAAEDVLSLMNIIDTTNKKS